MWTSSSKEPTTSGSHALRRWPDTSHAFKSGSQAARSARTGSGNTSSARNWNPMTDAIRIWPLPHYVVTELNALTNNPDADWVRIVVSKHPEFGWAVAA